MLLQLHRWRKKLILVAAVLPLCQAAGTCDTASIGNLVAQAGFGIATQINASVFQLMVGSLQQVLLQNFPSADLLQILLGGNRTPFFTG